jgi:hypothetical protein
MSYIVDWSEPAEEDLAAIWLATPSPLRPALRDATNRMDRLLTQDPVGNGTPCDGDFYVRVESLLFFYTVDERERRVEVVQVSVAP